MPNDIWNSAGATADWSTSGDWSAGIPGAATFAEISVGAANLNAETGLAGWLAVDVGTSFLATAAAALTVTNSIMNLGDFLVDQTGGGSSASVGRAFVNDGELEIGNASLSASDLLAVGQTYNLGTIDVQGAAALSATAQALLNVKSAAPSTLTGQWTVSGDADVDFASALVYYVGYSAHLELDGAAAKMTAGGTTGSALSQLSANYGAIALNGDVTQGQGGVQMTTTTGLRNVGSLAVDASSGAGGSVVNIGGVLTNVGSVMIGNATQAADTTVAAAGLTGSGDLYVAGGPAGASGTMTKLNVASAINNYLEGALKASGEVEINFTSGFLTIINQGGSLEIDGSGASVSNGGGVNSALTQLASVFGTFTLQSNASLGAVTLATTTALADMGTMKIDATAGDGGTTLTIDGELTIGNGADYLGSLQIGNAELSAATTVNATGLLVTNPRYLYGDSGSINVQGSASGDYAAALNISAAATAQLLGTLSVVGDAQVRFTSGHITSIGLESALTLVGALASVANSATENSALTKLSLNKGTLTFQSSDGGLGTGGVVLATTVGLTNDGGLVVDSAGGDGGSQITIGGALANAGRVELGNSSLSANTLLSVASLTTGPDSYVAVEGASASGGAQATLAAGSFTPTTLTGDWQLSGNAQVLFKAGAGIKTISGNLYLDGGEASFSNGGGVDSALSLGAIAGLLALESNDPLGSGDILMQTPGALSVTGTLDIDNNAGDGGTTLIVNGTLTVAGYAILGNSTLSTADMLQATQLNISGDLNLTGGSTASDAFTVDVSSALSSILSGDINLGGYASIVYASGYLTDLSGSLTINGGSANFSNGGGQYSALSKLSTVSGNLSLNGEFGNAITLTTTTGLTITGEMSVDLNASGSDVTIGGALVNEGTLQIGGGGYAVASTKMTATSLSDVGGSITLQGANFGSSEPQDATTLAITGAAPSAFTGDLTISNDAQVTFGSQYITTIETAGDIELNNSGAQVINNASSTSDLAHLASIDGNLSLQGNVTGSGFGYIDGTGGAALATNVGLTVRGSLAVDNLDYYFFEYYQESEGGSSLTIGGALTNDGSVSLGNYALQDASTISATALLNEGSLDILGGYGGALATLTSSAGATNQSLLTIGNNGELLVSSGAFSQSSGTTIVESGGILAASTINATGGLLDFQTALVSGDKVGTLNVGPTGKLEFDAAVDSSHSVEFSGLGGQLNLESASNFEGIIHGFSGTGADAIDLLNQTVTSLAYSGTTASGVLTAGGAGGTVATLSFVGNYSTGSFQTLSDGHGGTLII